jgi:ABC-type transport system involved in Fe-S cluster assembly fused permease/ATPase subunit
MFSKFAEVTTEGNYIQPPHELGNVTQIIVAHRLQTIIDADKIVRVRNWVIMY